MNTHVNVNTYIHCKGENKRKEEEVKKEEDNAYPLFSFTCFLDVSLWSIYYVFEYVYACDLCSTTTTLYLHYTE